MLCYLAGGVIGRARSPDCASKCCTECTVVFTTVKQPSGKILSEGIFIYGAIKLSRRGKGAQPF